MIQRTALFSLTALSGIGGVVAWVASPRKKPPQPLREDTYIPPRTASLATFLTELWRQRKTPGYERYMGELHERRVEFLASLCGPKKEPSEAKVLLQILIDYDARYRVPGFDFEPKATCLIGAGICFSSLEFDFLNNAWGPGLVTGAWVPRIDKQEKYSSLALESLRKMRCKSEQEVIQILRDATALRSNYELNILSDLGYWSDSSEFARAFLGLCKLLP